MTIPFVDLKAQYQQHKKEIDQAIRDVIAETGFVRSHFVTDFETSFAGAYGMKHCIGVANGTDAIYILLKMLGIGPGDEIITTAISWISTSETISQTGATPVFVDIHPETYLINADLIEKKITPLTKAVIPVHLYGQPAAMDKIAEICRKHNLLLIEDCAQAHFAEYKGKKAGTFGTASTFSFYPGKNLGAYGDAGAILTDDDQLAGKCRMYANHGALKKHEHLIEGINSRLDGLQAAILSAKLPFILEWNKKRLEHARYYNQLLSEIKEVITPSIDENARHIFHVYCIRTSNRSGLQEYLRKSGIETAIHYPVALPNMPAYKYLGYRPDDFPVASRYQSQILSLPMYPELTIEQMDYIVKTISQFFSIN
jgi:dTDP-4-amino-4,6-dideoxygalactose transaminase